MRLIFQINYYCLIDKFKSFVELLQIIHQLIIHSSSPSENREILLEETTEKTNSQKGGLLSKFFGPLMEVGISLMRNVLKQLAKSVLLPLRLTTTAPATQAAMQKKIYGTGITSLVISKEEMKDIMKVIKYLKAPGLIKKGVRKTIKKRSKRTKRWIYWCVISYIRC